MLGLRRRRTDHRRRSRRIRDDEMTRIIPPKLIAHLAHKPRPSPSPIQPEFSIDDLIERGREFYSNELKNGKNIGVKIALQNAVDSNLRIATLPYLIAGKATADRNNYLWDNWFTALSEEYVVVDKKGTSQVVVLHGGGILTPERIQRAYDDGLTLQNAAKLDNLEVSDLLKGKLPNGESIQIYTVDDIKNGRIPKPFGKYGIMLDFETAKRYNSDYLAKTDFMNNKLVMARAGTLEYLDKYFEKAKHPQNKNVGNWHRFAEINLLQNQGRFLYLNNSYDGLSGNDDLNYNGRFVGVVPEAHRP